MDKKEVYSEILSSDEIIRLGLILKKFENGMYDYKTLVHNMNEIGINIFPITIDLSKIVRIKDAKEAKTRFESLQFRPDDIRYFVISSSTYSNVIIRYDRTMIEALANYGDLDSQKTLIGILEYQCSQLSGPLTEKQRTTIKTWSDQIKYLKHQVSLNNGTKNKR